MGLGVRHTIVREALAALLAMGAGGRDGRSMASRAPSRVTSSGPLLVQKRTWDLAGSSLVKSTKADASVACPQRSKPRQGFR